MSRESFRLFCLLFLSSVFVHSCVKQRDLKSNTVIVRENAFPDGLHPTNSSSGVTSFIHSLTQKSLLSTDLATGKTIPLLVEFLPTTDSSGLIYRFQLKKGIFWDNKDELSIKDVIFSTKALLCPLTNNPQIRPIYASIIDSVYPDQKDERVFYMKAKNIHISNSEAIGGIPLLQQSHWDPNNTLNALTFSNIHSEKFTTTEALDKWFNQYNSADNSYVPEKLVGLGPYQVEKIEKDNFISLVRKKDWWGEAFVGADYDNRPKKIIFKIITDDTPAFLAIKNQEIDFNASRGGVSRLLKLQTKDYFNENYESEFVPTYGYTYIGLNTKPNESSQVPFFVDKNVRKAIAHLIPVDEIITVIKYGKATRQSSIVSTHKSACDTSLKPVEYNIEKARQLLSEAGWRDTDGDQIIDKMINGKKEQFSFKLNYITRGNNKEIVFMMKESLQKAGIQLISNPLDFNSHYGKASNHDFDAMIGVWGSGSGYSDPTQLWSTESWSNKGANFCGFGNSKSDSLIVKANTSLNEEEHLKAYKELQALIYEEQPYVFLWSDLLPMVSHKRFKNNNFYKARPNTSIGSYQLLE